MLLTRRSVSNLISSTTFRKIMTVYPSIDIAQRDDSVVDDYHGTKISDPYRWLEDPKSEQTKKWISAQNQIFDKYLQDTDKSLVDREKIIKDLTAMMDFEKVGAPFKRGRDNHDGDHIAYYYYKNDGLQNQSVLWKKNSLEPDDKEEVFLDPNTLSEDGTSSLGATSFSEDGHYFAYGVSSKGSDWQTINLKKVSDKQELKDHVLEYCKFTSIAWTHDSKGFYYTRFPKPSVDEEGHSLGSEVDKNENQKVYYHLLSKPNQQDDILVYSDDSHPTWMYGLEVSEDGKYLIISISESTAQVNRLYYAPISDPTQPLNVIKLIDNFDAEYSYITNTDDLFYFMTNKDASLKKVISIPLSDPNQVTEILPQHSTDPLQYVVPINENNLVAVYTHNVQDVIQVYQLQDGKYITDISLPTIGSVIGVSGRRSDTVLMYKFSSFTYAGTTYHYDLNTMQQKVFHETKTSSLIKSGDSFTVKQSWYQSADGTKVPIFIVHSVDTVLDGNNPVWLYGYGGFNIDMKPAFSVTRLFFIQQFGGIFAMPNLRGGGEFGEEWHKYGTLQHKQNVFNDMIAAAQFMISENYTRPEKMWINGGSNGGLLVAAVINQKPELFGAAVPQVGVLDMLRFHKFTIGHFWCSDYGCSDKKDDFEFLIKYSPLHNVKHDAQYPSVLVTTSDHDDRVVPLHSFKYAAELQYRAGPNNKRPLMIRVETKAGHGGGKPLKKVIEESADTFTFVANELKLKYLQ
ncbi:prolyl endopeptidase [Acrasis kona]|uniref:Prolyl endopeptidase n=1 Tax=Acrasis kona TaxID=1008807 RepID=A0AAW2YXA2_9EUKA